MLACPRCGRLVYSGTLKELAANAEAATASGDIATATANWTAALQLLPVDAGQRQAIEVKLQALQQPATPVGGASEGKKPAPKWLAWAGSAGPVLLFVLFKSKWLLLGLLKAKTLLSMLLYATVQAQTAGWVLAIGIVISIYIHEMGHVAMLSHYGIAASAPLFIPGVGALIFSKQRIDNPVQNARVGLAGPVAGLAAALACFVLFLITREEAFRRLTQIGAFINMFNLIPIWFLDGSRGFAGLSKLQRWMIAGVSLAVGIALGNGLAIGVALVAAGRILFYAKNDPEHPDQASFATFIVLLIALGLLSELPGIPKPELVPVPAPQLNRL